MKQKIPQEILDKIQEENKEFFKTVKLERSHENNLEKQFKLQKRV